MQAIAEKFINISDTALQVAGDPRHLDKLGSVTLPKPILSKYGLEKGADFTIDVIFKNNEQVVFVREGRHNGSYMSDVRRLDPLSRVTIPMKIRRELGMTEGSSVELEAYVYQSSLAFVVNPAN